MQRRKRQQPSYRQRKGYDQAIVTLTDSVTRYRKDYWLEASPLPAAATHTLRGPGAKPARFS